MNYYPLCKERSRREKEIAAIVIECDEWIKKQDLITEVDLDRSRDTIQGKISKVCDLGYIEKRPVLKDPRKYRYRQTQKGKDFLNTQRTALKRL